MECLIRFKHLWI